MNAMMFRKLEKFQISNSNFQTNTKPQKTTAYLIFGIRFLDFFTNYFMTNGNR